MNQKAEYAPGQQRLSEQYNALLRYVFPGDRPGAEFGGLAGEGDYPRQVSDHGKADVLGWFDGDTLVSQVAVYPMQVRIYGRTYAMGGLTGVGTYPIF